MDAMSDDIGSDCSSLVGLVGAVEGRRLALHSPRLILGRDAANCQLVLEHALISRQHALFETDGRGGVTVRDLGSTQGTFVNGAQVRERELRDGDCVGFGRGGLLAFRFHNTHGRPAPMQPATDPTPERFSVDQVRARLKVAGAAAARVPTGTGSMLPSDASVPAPSQKPVLRIGRAPENDIVLESPGVSRYHATVTYSAGVPHLADAGSTNGTYVNGEIVRSGRPVTPTDLVFLGGFLLRIDGGNVARHDLSSSRLTVREVSKGINGREILHDISFAILPREFIGLMGPSGCGKSTLMDALNGLRPASAGTVSINDLDLYRNFDAVRRSIGYVPQRDVLHDALSVEHTLIYAARLRLPAGTSDDELRRLVDEAITTVGLQEHRAAAFHQLSGGQQKRLSLAVELLTKPSFLFLDEPTSPLDPEASENLMLLFRRLADEGRIVVMVTHKFEKFEQMHQIALLTKGGRLAFFGPPKEALRYFSCSEPGEIYRRVASRDAREVDEAFRASPEYRTNVRSRLVESQEVLGVVKNLGSTPDQGRASKEPPGLRQWRILTERYLEIKLKDRRNTALLILQAPVIAVILSIIAGNTVNDAKTLFIVAIIAIWFGANNAIREIVAESAIYRRERLVNLKIPSYLFSKVTVLGAIGFIQCLLLLLTLVALGRLRVEDVPTSLVTLCLTVVGGTGLGLFFSALVNSAEKAMSVLPLLLIPQLLLSGFLKPIDDVYFNAQTGRPATAAAFQALQDAASGQPRFPGIPGSDGAEPITKIDGLGAARYVADLMIARWSVDALVHGVSRTDADARDRLASQLSIVAYRTVQHGSGPEAVTAAYDRQIRLDWLVLIAAAAVCIACAGWSLRRRDSL